MIDDVAAAERAGGDGKASAFDDAGDRHFVFLPSRPEPLKNRRWIVSSPRSCRRDTTMRPAHLAQVTGKYGGTSATSFSVRRGAGLARRTPWESPGEHPYTEVDIDIEIM